jgi:hypothetical protein
MDVTSSEHRTSAIKKYFDLKQKKNICENILGSFRTGKLKKHNKHELNTQTNIL